MISLRQALGLNNIGSIAFVGAGGKTTSMFRLARQLAPPVLVTATTHLATNQLGFADRHLYLVDPEQINELNELIYTDGVTLFTGTNTDRDRVRGLSGDLLNDLNQYSLTNRFPLLIEADGSRLKPLKAPEEHEPAIPRWVDAVSVVAGLGAIGEPLSDDNVHRLKIFSELSGLKPGQPITFDALVKVLLHSKGGLKNIPDEAARFLVLNQFDRLPPNVDIAQFAEQLSHVYDRVLLSSMQPEKLTQILNGEVIKTFGKIAGVVLAAGESSRFGEPKIFLDYQGKPFIRAVVERALTAGLSPVYVVLGKWVEEAEKVLSGLDVKILKNTEWEEGQSSSVRKAVEAFPQSISAAIFLLADMPHVPVDLIQRLIEYHRDTLAPVVAPFVHGKRTNPVLFDKSTFPELLKVTGDMGGRLIFAKYPPAGILWEDQRLLIDVDTPEDYRMLLDQYQDNE